MAKLNVVHQQAEPGGTVHHTKQKHTQSHMKGGGGHVHNGRTQRTQTHTHTSKDCLQFRGRGGGGVGRTDSRAGTKVAHRTTHTTIQAGADGAAKNKNKQKETTKRLRACRFAALPALFRCIAATTNGKPSV